MRRRIVAGNWKMTQTRSSAIALASAIKNGAVDQDTVKIVICPPFPYLISVAEAIAGSKIRLGAQNCYCKTDGAFTGEISPTMLADIECKYVILGHSERRHQLGEDDSFVNQKVRLALEKNLRVILCVGETLQEREDGRMEEVFFRQLATALVGLSSEHMDRLVIAYEPVWAIGTGHTATPDQAQSAHYWIRQHIVKDFGEQAGTTLPILYGGSVNEKTAANLFKQPDVDGGLVGTASWTSEPFLKIIEAASAAR